MMPSEYPCLWSRRFVSWILTMYRSGLNDLFSFDIRVRSLIGAGPVLHPCSARMSFKLTLFGTRADTEPLAAASLCSFRRGDCGGQCCASFHPQNCHQGR